MKEEPMRRAIPRRSQLPGMPTSPAPRPMPRVEKQGRFDAEVWAEFQFEIARRLYVPLFFSQEGQKIFVNAGRLSYPSDLPPDPRVESLLACSDFDELDTQLAKTLQGILVRRGIDKTIALSLMVVQIRSVVPENVSVSRKKKKK